MRRHALFLALLIVFARLTLAQTTEVFKYQLYDNLKEENIASVKNKLNNNVTRIMGNLDLDVQKAGTFTVHIWRNRENYLVVQEQRLGKRYPQSNGYVMAYNEIGLIYFDNPQPLINASGLKYAYLADDIAEHEFTHCVSMRVNQWFPNNPRWLWEAVAMYESNEYYDPRTISYLKLGNYLTLHELNTDFNEGNYKIYQVGYLIGK